MVPVAVDHFPHTVQVLICPLRIMGKFDIGVCLITCFIHYINTQFIGQIQILHIGRIMAGTHAVDVKLLHQVEILFYGFHIHGVTGFGMQHMAVHSIEFNGYTIDTDGLVNDLHFPETNPGAEHLQNLIAIHKLHHKGIEMRVFGRPKKRITDFQGMLQDLLCFTFHHTNGYHGLAFRQR